jgi:hypothetical protein
MSLSLTQLPVINNEAKGINSFENHTQAGNLNGKGVVFIDPSNKTRKSFLAGVGPGMWDGVWTDLARIFTTIVLLFATVTATLAVGIATRARKPTLVTLGIGLSASALTNLFYRIKS